MCDAGVFLSCLLQQAKPTAKIPATTKAVHKQVQIGSSAPVTLRATVPPSRHRPRHGVRSLGPGKQTKRNFELSMDDMHDYTALVVNNPPCVVSKAQPAFDVSVVYFVTPTFSLALHCSCKCPVYCQE